MSLFMKRPLEDEPLFISKKQKIVQLPSPAATPENEKSIDLSSSVIPRKLAFDLTIFNQAKSLFQRSYNYQHSVSLPGREEECEQLQDFISRCISQNESDSLYISGPPGTGKTAQLNCIIQHMFEHQSNSQYSVEIDDKVHEVGICTINCMTLKSSQDVFHQIYTQMKGPSEKKRGVVEVTELLSKGMSVIVLDEMDKLVTSDQQILFDLFLMAKSKECKLVLIGIANALDMADRLLPRLKMNGLNPKTMSFKPYNTAQMAKIINGKLASLGPAALFQPSAVQFIAKKMSSNTGDLRKAFDICRSSIECLELGLMQKGEDLGSFTLENCPKVSISHVAKVCTKSFGGQKPQVKNLTLQQKFVLCCLVNLEDTHFDRIDVNKFYDHYLIKHGDFNSMIGSLKRPEFLEILGALEIHSLIKMERVRNGTVLRSTVVRKELIEDISKIGILKNII